MKRIFKNFLPVIGLTMAFMFALPADAFAESWDANLRLDMPQLSYEGHSITLTDASLYHLGSSTDTRSFSNAEEASNAGCINTSWIGNYTVLSEIRSTAGAILQRTVKYKSPGTYEAGICSLWLAGAYAGTSETVTESIEIKACPAVDSLVLGGVQRAYQKQSVSVRLAQNPSYPVNTSSISISLQDSSGNLVHYCRTPVIETENSNEFINCSMEFLTKNQSDECFSLVIRAADSRGRQLDYEYEFQVLRDKAPQASISIARSFYRSEGGAPATVTASFNGSASDDLTSLEWTFPTDAKNCTCDGATISFQLSAPGWYSLTVKATDIWQDTLGEFVSDSERKSASYSVKFKIENKAPKLKSEVPLESKSLELMLVNGSASSAENLKSDFIDLNIAASIYPVSISDSGSGGDFARTGGTSYSSAALLDCNDNWEKMISCDDNYCFVFYTATVSGTTVSGPYYLQRTKLDGSESVSFSYSADTFGNTTKAASVKLGYDLQGKYLYLVLGGKTFLIDKTTGNLTATVNSVLGTCNTVYGNYVYSFTDSAILKLNLSDNSVSNIYDCECLTADTQSARLKYGKIYCAVKINSAVYRAVFKPSDESISLAKLYDNTGKDYLLATTPLCGICLASRDSTGSASAVVRTFDINGNQTGNAVTVSLSAYFINYPQYCGIWPVFDKSGAVNYVYSPTVTLPNKSITVTLYGLYDGYTETTSTGQKDKSKGSALATDFRKCDLAIQLDDGTVIIASGAGYYSSMKKSYCNCYYFKTGSNALTSITTPYIYSEWGFHWNGYWVTGTNLAGAGQINIYKFEEGYSNQLLRKEYETLQNDKDYKYSTASTDAAGIAATLGISTASSGPLTVPVLTYKIGDIVRLEDFGLKTSLFYDYENDTPFTAENSLGLPRSFSKAGIYTFYYRVKDCCGSAAFDKYSNKIYCRFYVTTDGGDANSGDSGGDGTGTENEPAATTTGSLRFVLHRRF